MTSLREAISQLHKLGVIVTGPVTLSVDSGLDSASILEQALARSFKRNQRVLESYPPFTRGREEQLVVRRPDGKILRHRQRAK